MARRADETEAPKGPSGERRRHNQTFRISDDLRNRLKTAADAAQNSISEEVEIRIERSFRRDDEQIFVKSLSTRHTDEFARAIATYISLVEISNGKSFIDDPKTASNVIWGIERMLEKMRVALRTSSHDDHGSLGNFLFLAMSDFSIHDFLSEICDVPSSSRDLLFAEYIRKFADAERSGDDPPPSSTMVDFK